MSDLHDRLAEALAWLGPDAKHAVADVIAVIEEDQ